jgi:glycosyltransferase involved in cell wall biosynthesis
MNPFFSIITVVKNNINTIERTIKSVLSQDFLDFEYIIIDGDSTDGTKELIKNYSDRNNKIKFYSELDDGLYYAMNKGIIKSKGNFIALLNSDDYYISNSVLSTYYKNIIKEEDSTFIIFYSGMKIGTGNIEIIDIKPDKPYLKKNMRMNHPTWFVSKDVYLKIGRFDTNYRIASDYDFALRALLANVNFVEINNYFPVFFAIGGISMLSSKSINESFEIRKKYHLIGKTLNYLFFYLEHLDLMIFKIKKRIKFW